MIFSVMTAAPLLLALFLALSPAKKPVRRHRACGKAR